MILILVNALVINLHFFYHFTNYNRHFLEIFYFR